MSVIQSAVSGKSTDSHSISKSGSQSIRIDFSCTPVMAVHTSELDYISILVGVGCRLSPHLRKKGNEHGRNIHRYNTRQHR